MYGNLTGGNLRSIRNQGVQVLLPCPLPASVVGLLRAGSVLEGAYRDQRAAAGVYHAVVHEAFDIADDGDEALVFERTTSPVSVTPS